MQRFSIALLALAALPAAFYTTAAANSSEGSENTVAPSRQITIASYNIRNAIGMDDRCDYDRLAAAIDRLDADIVAVQEVDSITGRSHGRYVLGEIAARTQHHPYFAPAIDYDGGKYGIGLLSRHEPTAVKRIALPGREEERALIVAEYPEFVMANTHLSLTPEDALASVDAIVTEARAAAKPFIVAGDWNSLPDSPVIATLTEAGFRLVSDGKTPTWPADTPTDCIDYIAVYSPDSAAVAATSAAVVDEPMASDHRPVRATLQLRPHRIRK